MSYNATFFLEPQATARSGTDPVTVLYQVATAERILTAVQEWRDSIVACRDRHRTAADELAQAHAEIARLKAEAEGGDET